MEDRPRLMTHGTMGKMSYQARFDAFRFPNAFGFTDTVDAHFASLLTEYCFYFLREEDPKGFQADLSIDRLEIGLRLISAF